MGVKKVIGPLIGTGTCFDDVNITIRNLVDDRGRDFSDTLITPFICHGLIERNDGLIYAHAWVEYENEMYDHKIDLNSKEQLLVIYSPKEFKERFTILKVTKYSLLEAMAKVIEAGENTTGPWEEIYQKHCDD